MARINVGGGRVEERGVVRKQLPYPPICCFALFCSILEHIYFRHPFLPIFCSSPSSRSFAVLTTRLCSIFLFQGPAEVGRSLGFLIRNSCF